MSGITCTLLLITALAGQPLSLEVDRGAEALVVQFKLAGELPPSVESSLESGLATEIDYTLRVYARRQGECDLRRRDGTLPMPGDRQWNDYDQPRGGHSRSRPSLARSTTCGGDTVAAWAAGRVSAGPRTRGFFERYSLADLPFDRGYGLDRGASRGVAGRHMSSAFHGGSDVTR